MGIKGKGEFLFNYVYKLMCNKTFAYAWLSFASGFDAANYSYVVLDYNFTKKEKKIQNEQTKTKKECNKRIFTVTYLFSFAIENLLNPQVTLLTQLRKNFVWLRS